MAGLEIQGSLFEQDYLLRSLGVLAHSPDAALTELVANAWDAGASRVDVQIPLQLDQALVVEDDGTGLTATEFRTRWMTLGYDRVRHQGAGAAFPAERTSWRRSAYGRNGVGRHGMLCFASRYEVDTWRDGVCSSFVIATSSGQNPFVLESESTALREGHGTCLRALVNRHLPAADSVRDVLAARFLHDPRFEVTVNGRSVPLAEHSGLVKTTELRISDTTKAVAYFIDSTKAARTTHYQGIAFWVGGRLVGEPSWVLNGQAVIDGRTRLAKRYTAVIQSDDLFEEVLPDWSAFRRNDLTEQLFTVVSGYVVGVFREVSRERVQETRNTIIRDHHSELAALQPLARLEVQEFIESITDAQPLAQSETVSAAVKAVINLERSRSGAALLERLSTLSEEDVEGLDRLLSDWSVRDALSVLDEIGRRLTTLEAIKKLSSDPHVDELHTLHPLVTQARWLFGPEFDSPEFASNASLKAAVLKVFGKKVSTGAFINERRRPDLISLSDATVSAVATESFDESTHLVAFREVLIVELKRGQSTINRENVHQACDYVEDLLRSGHLDGQPTVRAFVVGHVASEKVDPSRTIGERGRVFVTTYGQLVRTGEKRLFSLRERLAERYDLLSGTDLLQQLDDGSGQLSLADEAREGEKRSA